MREPGRTSATYEISGGEIFVEKIGPPTAWRATVHLYEIPAVVRLVTGGDTEALALAEAMKAVEAAEALLTAADVELQK